MSEVVQIHDGCSIYKRADAIKGRWYSYVYLDGTEVHKSTKTTDRERAIQIAKDRFDEAKEKTHRGQSIVTPTFRKAAEMRLAERLAAVDLSEKRRELTKNRASAKRNEFNRTVNNYLIPFVEEQIGAQTSIDQLGKVDWDEYPEWRQDIRDTELFEKQDELTQRERELRAEWDRSSRTRKWYADVDAYVSKGMPTSAHGMGHIQPKVRPATFATEYAILRDLTKWCRHQKRRWITKYDEPELPKIDRVDRPRFGFTIKEMEELRLVARQRFSETRKKIKARAEAHGLNVNEVLAADTEAASRYKTLLALDILCATGMRPGALCALRRTNVQENPTQSEMRAAIDPTINAFGHARRTDGTEFPTYALRVTSKKGGRLIEHPVIPEAWALHSIDLLMQMTTGDNHLIGGTSHQLGKAIGKVIREAGLERGTSGEIRSQYDIRHGYITKKLIEGVPPIVVANNVLSSLEMIERHYSKMTSLHHFDALSADK